jgi:mono/diheme cytochrome c family protein
MKWTMFAIFCAACILGLSVLFTSIPDEKHEEAAPIVDAPLDIAAAETVYAKSCISCHGDQLKGGAGPQLTDVGTRLTQAQIASKIQKGAGIMPGFQNTLSAEEIGNLSKWLSEKK